MQLNKPPNDPHEVTRREDAERHKLGILHRYWDAKEHPELHFELDELQKLQNTSVEAVKMIRQEIINKGKEVFKRKN